jgi:anti-sigma regulatory factor (Ser/Thr protein kinase)
MEKKFKREMASLEKLFEFVKVFIATNRINESTAFSLKLAIEEIFTNLVKYDHKASGEIPVSLDLMNDRVVVTLLNIGGQRYDISAVENVNVDLPLHQREIGGLGLHLVRSMVDDLAYEYKQDTGKITIIKVLED